MLTLKRYAPFHSLSSHVRKCMSVNFTHSFSFPSNLPPFHPSYGSFFRLTARQDEYIIGLRSVMLKT